MRAVLLGGAHREDRERAARREIADVGVGAGEADVHLGVGGALLGPQPGRNQVERRALGVDLVRVNSAEDPRQQLGSGMRGLRCARSRPYALTSAMPSGVSRS